TVAAKIAAIAQATINTYLAATEALKLPSPPPIPQIAAGLAIATGLQFVGKIAGIKAEHGLEVSGDGKGVTTFREGRISGRKHSEGGVKGKIRGIPVEAEDGETFAYDRHGNAVIM